MEDFVNKWNFLLGKGDVDISGFVKEDIENEIVNAIKSKGNIFYYVTYNWGNETRSSFLEDIKIKQGLTPLDLENEIIAKVWDFRKDKKAFENFPHFYRYLCKTGYHLMIQKRKDLFADIPHIVFFADSDKLDIFNYDEREVIVLRMLFRQLEKSHPFCYQLIYKKDIEGYKYDELVKIDDYANSTPEALRQQMTSCKKRFRNFLTTPIKSVSTC